MRERLVGEYDSLSEAQEAITDVAECKESVLFAMSWIIQEGSNSRPLRTGQNAALRALLGKIQHS